MHFISLDHIIKTYGKGESSVAALDGISLTIDQGDFLAIMGESGAGKSTLLSILGAMSTPTSGRYRVDGMDVYALTNEQQADFRREYLGFVFQSFHLVSYLTVLENVMLPLATIRLKRQQKKGMAIEALQWVGLEEKGRRLPGEISGGECERLPWPEPSSINRRSSWPMSPRVIWTPATARISCPCSGVCTLTQPPSSW